MAESLPPAGALAPCDPCECSCDGGQRLEAVHGFCSLATLSRARTQVLSLSLCSSNALRRSIRRIPPVAAPMTYERGWGKKLSYVLGFSAHEVTDVSRRYSANWKASLARRTAVDEAWLASLIRESNASVQHGLPLHEREAMVERAQREARLLLAREQAPHAFTALSAQERRGRRTGSLEWRRTRGERHLAQEVTTSSMGRRACGPCMWSDGGRCPRPLL